MISAIADTHAVIWYLYDDDAATALHLNVPLISRDEKIKISRVETIW